MTAGLRECTMHLYDSSQCQEKVSIMSKPAHITVTNHKELYALQTYSQTRAPQSGMMHLLGSSDPDQTKTLG